MQSQNDIAMQIPERQMAKRQLPMRKNNNHAEQSG